MSSDPTPKPATWHRSPTAARPPRLLVVPDSNSYRRAAPAPVGSGPDTFSEETGRPGVTLATMPPTRLQRAIAWTATCAIATAVRIDDIDMHTWADNEDGSPLLVDPDSELRALQDDVTYNTRRAANTRAALADADNPTNRRAIARKADQFERAAAASRQRVADLLSRPPGQLGLPAPSHPHKVAAALSLLAAGEPTAPAESYQMQQVIQDLALVPDGLILHGSFKLAVVIDGHLTRLGPIGFTLPNSCTNGGAVLLATTAMNPATMAPAFRSPSYKPPASRPGRQRWPRPPTPAHSPKSCWGNHP